ncbi:hypothetical protein [Flavobacterium sp.]|uniref:hypothetical protein n=1 Tax=Flavobacterium sp. TaxID=239 RepID=UPI003751A9D4
MTITEYISIGTLTVSILLLIFNAKKLLFVNVITKERINYIEKLRNTLAEYISLIEYEGNNDKENTENNQLIILKYNYLKLMLNPDNEIDKLIIKEIEDLFNSFNDRDKNILEKCRNFTIMSQRVIHFEWKGIQNETKYFINKSKFTENFLKMVKKSIPVILFLFPIFSFSQITIGSVEKKGIEVVEPKPIPFDSIYDYKEQEDLINYKMYIGQKIYLPKYNNNEDFSYVGKEYPFMFADSLSKVNIDPIRELKMVDNMGSKTNKIYKNIFTYKYKPFHYYSGVVNGNAYASINTNADEVSNKYYTVIDVYTGEEMKTILDNIKKLINNRNDNYDNYIDDVGFNNYDIYDMSKIIFKIQDDITKEQIYVFNLNYFILVPYFVKQKEIYNSKKIIAVLSNENFETTDFSKNEKFNLPNKSIWNCEVTLLSKKEIFAKDDYKLKMGSYFIAYKLTNEKGQIIIFKGLNGENLNFKIYEDYVNEENDKKLQQAQLIARNKKLKQSETEKRLAKEKVYLNKCIAMFGDYYGNLVNNNNIVIGMTKEMCEMSWGKPFDKSTIIYENITKVYWYYSWKKNLYFENGKLIRIEK